MVNNSELSSSHGNGMKMGKNSYMIFLDSSCKCNSRVMSRKTIH